VLEPPVRGSVATLADVVGATSTCTADTVTTAVAHTNSEPGGGVAASRRATLPAVVLVVLAVVVVVGCATAAHTRYVKVSLVVNVESGSYRTSWPAVGVAEP